MNVDDLTVQSENSAAIVLLAVCQIFLVTEFIICGTIPESKVNVQFSEIAL